MSKELAELKKQKPVNLRRGDLLRCIETDELCTVWATSTTGNTLIKWSANNFGNYTAEQIGELFWLEPAPVQQDIPDLIAGALGVSRGTAYDMMREALKDTSPEPLNRKEKT